MTFNTLLNKYRKVSFSEKDKGERFERLMQAYLLTDPQYSNRLKKVWLWNEFHGRNDLGGSDTGIDLVAQTLDGDYWAIQCKCFQENAVIDKPAVDSFLSTSGRKFKSEDLQTIGFSHRLWISTSNKWGPNATEAIRNQHPAVTRLNLHDLQEAPVDWEKLDKGIHGDASRAPKKSLRPHQKEALNSTHTYFKTADRGQLIMACGTGKTFNSLRIAENETNGKGLVLFLVPSIALLGQTLREWSADANEPIHAICICSDPEISRKKTKNDDSDTFSVVDLALPASTNKEDILRQFNHIRTHPPAGMTVVFSTYQSIKVIAEAQKEMIKKGFGEFDLIICDEAHRTTGVTLSDEDESAFTKVHDNDFIKAGKRLYMTATPRLYSDDTKSKAAQAEAVLCSMDDEQLYGKEIYRIGFGEAVEKDLLSDYKVLILTLSDKDIPPAVQDIIADKKSEINTDDASKLIGCINALSKKILGDEGVIQSSDPEPMRRAVAFCSSIAVSKKITATYNSTADVYLDALPYEKKGQMVSVASKHIDGTMAAPQRDELLSWLKADSSGNECRVLTNVRCLSEGVDVPSLDAVMFLSARNSQVDVVQSVGRVMRKAPGKKYGYIIIPVVVPSDVDAASALDDNARYKVVWTVLNALRAHDDRFNATINKIELNKKKPNNILVGRPEYTFDNDGMASMVNEDEAPYNTRSISQQMSLQFEQLQSVMFARLVQKVGDRRYWEQWARSVAEIAQRQTERITKIINEDNRHHQAFDNFLKGLHKNINTSITQAEAIEMLSQHIITRPVFDALFENYSFVRNNPVSQSMQKMLDLLEEQSLEKDALVLEKFYASVKTRASGIDNAEGKQRIIIELYDKFFKTAFPKMVERLGIVYTPIEVVDFIIHSVSDILQKEFNRSISDENVHILDPFTGTGTFITRLLQSGLIRKEDMERKYNHEIHCNEIVLLAYYIAAVNIENAYHDIILPDAPPGKTNGIYKAFQGICLTDTFQLGETEDGEKLFSEMFPQNSERVQRQKKAPLKIIMGNPPYSVGQNSANDNAQNQTYEKLNQRIANTYAKETQATNKNSLYDSYIKAFRWSTDRLDKNGGIICFVSNGAWLDGNSADGFRKSIEKEFTSIYVFNLRGNARTSGELRQKEAGNVFGIGSRTPIAITLLVKNPAASADKAAIHYRDIGDYLGREEKLKIIHDFKTFANSRLLLKSLQPNEHGDWISLRSDSFSTFIAIDSERKFEVKAQSWFVVNSRGLETGRDAWIYNSSKETLSIKINSSIAFYNSEIDRHTATKRKSENVRATDFINTDPTKLSWTSSLVAKFDKGEKILFESDKIEIGIYRPYIKQYVYRGNKMIHRRGQFEEFFPNPSLKNLVICVSQTFKDGSIIITNKIPDLHFNGDTQAFPLYYYEENNAIQKGLFDEDSGQQYTRRDAISDFIFERARKQYGLKAPSPSGRAGEGLTKEDIFYYVYGFLHSRQYRETFANDLKKMLPRLPLVEPVKDFWAFSKAGRQLAELHLNYESVAPYPDVKVEGDDSESYMVEKMRFPKKGQKNTIIYNSRITVSNIPAKAYEYVVNGKSAIEWIMERYQITTHKESGITNNPNDWATEHNQPRYILDLLLSIVNVSVQTVDIMEGLPKVRFE
ncbi:type ISP restriction/modification enzyme [Agriterribacter sp.]|uniref:DEAD/DEAH box helicase n=1 Tax=Agriterribacter sp. TaxID=2821509 RepID=UPI002BA3F171|nr:type ISP restriction/modification enzyme [Agriterribacter sp.]HRO46086.1 DEAD/DEAH box helicase family protein [Agriterribacter sp.]HRQ16146.1 DEAD/DEAH box helicase family protein [Agriterribacter sp.]